MRRFRRRFFANRGGAVGIAIMLLVVARRGAARRGSIPAIRSMRSRGRCCRRSKMPAICSAPTATAATSRPASRMGRACRSMIGVTAAAGAILIGTVIGALAGFYRGWIDDALMRLTDAAQTVPNFLLALALSRCSDPRPGASSRRSRWCRGRARHASFAPNSFRCASASSCSPAAPWAWATAG